MSWSAVKLGDVCIDGGIQTGPFGSQLHQSDYSDEGTPVVMPVDLADGGISTERIARVSDDHVQRLSRHMLEPGDVVYARRGDVGRCSRVTESEKGWLCGTGCLRLRADSNLVDKTFLYYALSNPSVVGWVRNHAIGATMPNLNTTILGDVPLYIPDNLEDQRRIASILMAYDNLIENNRSQIALLEEAAQRLYKEWFVDLRFPGHESTGISEGLPNGWTEAMLKDIADVVMGQSPKSEYYNDTGEGLPFHQGVSSFGLRFVRDETYTTSVTRIGKAGSILFSVRAPVGRLNYTKNEIVLGRGLAAMNHRQGLQSYLYYMLKERFFKEDMIGNGSIFASISKGDLLAQKFVVPDGAMAERFNTLCRPIDKQIERCDDAIRAATEARDRLLPKLMSDEIEAL